MSDFRKYENRMRFLPGETTEEERNKRVLKQYTIPEARDRVKSSIQRIRKLCKTEKYCPIEHSYFLARLKIDWCCYKMNMRDYYKES